MQRKRRPPKAAPKTLKKGLGMPLAPQRSIQDSPPEPPADLRMLVSVRPEALYLEARELARILGCSETAAEEGRRWVVEDGLEIAA
jgi:hypothetical protein